MSDPSKSREMKERWRDPEYRARTTQALQKAGERYRDNPRSVAEAIYRLNRFNADHRASQRHPVSPKT